MLSDSNSLTFQNGQAPTIFESLALLERTLALFFERFSFTLKISMAEGMDDSLSMLSEVEKSVDNRPQGEMYIGDRSGLGFTQQQDNQKEIYTLSYAFFRTPDVSISDQLTDVLYPEIEASRSQVDAKPAKGSQQENNNIKWYQQQEAPLRLGHWEALSYVFWGSLQVPIKTWFDSHALKAWHDNNNVTFNPYAQRLLWFSGMLPAMRLGRFCVELATGLMLLALLVVKVCLDACTPTFTWHFNRSTNLASGGEHVVGHDNKLDIIGKLLTIITLPLVVCTWLIGLAEGAILRIQNHSGVSSHLKSLMALPFELFLLPSKLFFNFSYLLLGGVAAFLVQSVRTIKPIVQAVMSAFYLGVPAAFACALFPITAIKQMVSPTKHHDEDSQDMGFLRKAQCAIKGALTLDVYTSPSGKRRYPK